MKQEYDALVIGGGASGMAAAITLKRMRPAWDVAVLEKNDIFLRKVQASGNGRCNISNLACDGQGEVKDFLSSVGISLRNDGEGRLYPYSEDAKDVARLLIRTATSIGVELLPEAEVERINAVPTEKDPRGGFRVLIKGDDEYISCEKLVLATGGKSHAEFGTTGDGYTFARRMGHSVTKLVPALTGVEVRDNILNLKGVRAKAKAYLLRDGETVFSEKGEVQFREDSLSGIVIMNMSGRIETLQNESPENSFKHYEIRLDLAPEFTSQEVRDLILERLNMPGFDEEYALKSLVRVELARYIIRKENVFFARWLGEKASKEEIADFLADELKDLKFKVRGLKGWDEAQVTKGGVPASEVDPVTMESRIVKGLYLTGEVLDYDGPCGGYNLNNAWLTGIKAGRGIAQSR
ncbi:MAG: aminoacetone oxidase family FAD-binding enzyme [Clostridia bacterium]|nr:aminoacetone oxidase family FAD-binding enzyme [Clostridia bacterium]